MNIERLKLWVLKAVLKWYGGSVMYKVAARDCLVSWRDNRGYVSHCHFFCDLPIKGDFSVTINPRPQPTETINLFDERKSDDNYDESSSAVGIPIANL